MYALHPGPVTSKNDGDIHDISCVQLARLYGLRQQEYICWYNKDRWFMSFIGKNWDDYIHLYPRYHGDYDLPEKKGVPF